MTGPSLNDPLEQRARELAQTTTYSLHQIQEAVFIINTVRWTQERPPVPLDVWIRIMEPGIALSTTTGQDLAFCYAAILDGAII